MRDLLGEGRLAAGRQPVCKPNFYNLKILPKLLPEGRILNHAARN